MLIEQIKFIENPPYDYQLNFIYDGNNLQTGSTDKTATQQEVVSIVKNLVNDFDAHRAKTNYNNLKASFEGKSVNI